MKKVADFIVRFNKLFLLLFVGLCIACGFTASLVNVEYDITAYLNEETDTKQAIDIMDNEFTTYGTSSFVLENISFDEADELHNKILDIKGVKDLPFENTPDYYHDLRALFTVTYDGTEDDEVCVEAYNQIKFYLQDYHVLISTSLVDTTAEELSQDVLIITICAVAIIILVVIFTSRNFLDIVVLLPVFGVAALLNMGTNWFFGTISFVTNSVCIILQLALAIDYAIILLHRFAEEKTKRENLDDPKKVMSAALAKGIPEILGSSLTTICGLVALVFMSFTLGRDLGLVLAKAIVCSMLSVFFFMPSIALLFSKPMKKTEHKNFVPRIDFLGKALFKIRYAIVPIFITVVGVLGYFSFNLNYVYSATSIDTFFPTENMKARNEIEKIFGAKNQFAILVPHDEDNFDEEKEVVNILKEENTISEILAISNVEVTLSGGPIYLTDKLNYREFSTTVGIEESLCEWLYRGYATTTKDKEVSELAKFEFDKDNYRVSLLNMLNRLNENEGVAESALSGNPETLSSYKDAQKQVQDAQGQLIGPHYTRVVINITTEVESKETFQLIERLKLSIKEDHPKTIFAGDSMSSYDLDSTFGKDNILISVLSIVFVYIVLIFTTTKCWGLPILMVATIQGSIFINFGLPALIGRNLFFLVYLVVSAIQMGATIDYAIVLTTRYLELRKTEHRKDAMYKAISDAFPTILTSGVIMISAGLLVGFIARMPLIGTLGLALARGVTISILSVLLVLPILLYFFGDFLMLKTKLPDVKINFKEAFALRKNKNKNSNNEERIIDVKSHSNVDKKEKTT